MLKFDSLALFGFKSFADKTRVVFHDRITAVVGPNGCGKSNLSDALSWTLGLQRAHGLRGQNMQDIIFSGTSKRKPSGFSKVTIRVTRTDSTPLLLDGEEIEGKKLEITRRLYRTGEGAYLINRRRVRLMDIQRFIDESGLGFAPYALIAQGKIDSFLNAKALDRRAVIEEAAQISAYRSRRRSAELKLEMAQQNLLRINDIVLEVERQLRSLKRQAAKARRYAGLKTEFEELQRARFALEARSYSKKREELEGALAELESQQQTLQSDLEASEKEYAASIEEREELQSHLSQLEQERSKARLELDRAQNSRTHHEEQIAALRRQLDNYSSEERSLQAALERVAEDLKQFGEERVQIEERQAEVDAELEDCRAQVEGCAKESAQAESRLESLRQEFLQASSQTASLENQGRQLAERFQVLQRDQQRLEEECSRGQGELEARQAALRADQEAQTQQETLLEELRSELEDRLQERSAAEIDLKALKKERDELNSRLIAARERLQSLQEVEVSRSQYSEGVKKLLTHLGRNGVINNDGTLADHLETEPEYERLVEEFLDDELEYVLVDSLDDAVRGVGELRNLKTGKCTFLSLMSRESSPQPGTSLNGLTGEEGVHGALGDLLDMSPQVKQAFFRALPAHAGAVVVSDLDRAVVLSRSHPDHTFITLRGEALSSSGLLTATASSSKKLGLLSLKRQKKDLESKLARIQKGQFQVQSRVQTCSARFEALDEACLSTRDRLHQAEKELVGLSHRVEHGQADLRRRSESLDGLQQRFETVRSELKAAATQSEEIQGVLQENVGRRAEIQGTLDQCLRESAHLKSVGDEARNRLLNISSDSKVLEERRAALERTMSRTLEQKAGLENRLEAGSKAEEENKKRLIMMSESLQDVVQRLQALTNNDHESARLLEEAKAAHEQWRRHHPQIDQRLKDLRNQSAQAQQQRSDLEIESARVETQLQNIDQLCRENLDMDAVEAAEHVDLENRTLESVLGPYQECKQRLEKFGPINMRALEEFQENEERHEYLTGQRNDVEKSIADTTLAIQDLNRRSREMFKEAFEAINGHFQTIFRKLFGGGDCGMRLLDEEDILESGLDVFAQPPGKRLQNVSLLSGGEKALTGLALLMGLFHYRPSRFCILDEVDAPLDDANVRRFISLIKEMSEKTQFIMITHNKRSMEAADAIYGVTMQEAGVSKVVSVQLQP